MHPAITIRPAQPDDWTLIAEHLQRSHLPLGGARDHLDGFLLAWKGHNLVASAALERFGDVALLRSVAVAETERGQGLGSDLVEHTLNQARQEGLCSLVLLTETAKDFFARFGFRPIARADAPASVYGSIEFQSACPASAAVMQLDF